MFSVTRSEPELMTHTHTIPGARSCDSLWRACVPLACVLYGQFSPASSIFPTFLPFLSFGFNKVMRLNARSIRSEASMGLRRRLHREFSFLYFLIVLFVCFSLLDILSTRLAVFSPGHIVYALLDHRPFFYRQHCIYSSFCVCPSCSLHLQLFHIVSTSTVPSFTTFHWYFSFIPALVQRKKNFFFFGGVSMDDELFLFFQSCPKTSELNDAREIRNSGSPSAVSRPVPTHHHIFGMMARIFIIRIYTSMSP